MLQFPKDIDEFDFCASLLRYRFSLGGEAAWRCDIGVCSVLCASRKRIRSGQVGRIKYVVRFYVRCHCKSLRLRNRVSTCKQCCSRNMYKKKPMEFAHWCLLRVWRSVHMLETCAKCVCFTAFSGRMPRNMCTPIFRKHGIRL